MTGAAHSILEAIGDYWLLLRAVLKDVFTNGINARDLGKQVVYIGNQSIPIVLLTAAFTGMVMALQTAYGLQRFGAKLYVGNIVSLALVRELGPALTGVMLCGRVGAGIAAEIGSMVVTEQVDAIRSLGADPIRKLVSPRIAAAVFVLPLLVVLADLIGILGGGVIAVLELDLTRHTYYRSIVNFVTLRDVFDGLIKSAFFGFLFVSIACFIGLRCRGGTEGVGRATTEAVVFGSIVILISDLFLTKFLIILS
ncbi:MAG: ABC transporter permease [Bdellovibrionales bacterium]|nr:ABC transporter permease [Bdellovibrionales bacterium]